METSKTSGGADKGKAFEGMVSRAFRELDKTYPISFKRLIDSREAGNIVKAQESDFELIVKSGLPGRPFHFMIEAKSSEKFETFSTCFRPMVKVNQRAKMMARERAGCKGLYLFFSEKLGHIELWDGDVICEAWPHKRKPLNAQPRMVIDRKNLDEFAVYLIRNPAEFILPRQ